MPEDEMSREAIAMIGDELKEIRLTQRLHSMALAKLDERFDKVDNTLNLILERLDK